MGDKSGTLTFLPGETRKEIELQLADNALVDGNRQYTIGMVRPTNATIASSGVATIVDNDILPPGPTAVDIGKDSDANISNDEVSRGKVDVKVTFPTEGTAWKPTTDVVVVNDGKRHHTTIDTAKYPRWFCGCQSRCTC